jgi:hypothetical protein
MNLHSWWLPSEGLSRPERLEPASQPRRDGDGGQGWGRATRWHDHQGPIQRLCYLRLERLWLMEHVDHGRRLVGVDEDLECSTCIKEKKAAISSRPLCHVQCFIVILHGGWQLIEAIDLHIVLACMYGGPINPWMSSYIDHWMQSTLNQRSTLFQVCLLAMSLRLMVMGGGSLAKLGVVRATFPIGLFFPFPSITSWKILFSKHTSNHII